MTPQGVSGIFLKISRARRHLDEAKDVSYNYMQSEPFILQELEEAESGALATVVYIKAQPPLELSAAIGDAVHNARSALDHLAWHLVEKNGAKPDRSTCFPIADDSTKFEKAVKRTLLGVSNSDKEAIRSVAAYPGGDDRLHSLHQLDIEDKHHLLLAVGMVNRSVNLHLSMGDNPKFGKIEPLSIIPKDSAFPLVSGSVIFRIEKAAREEGAGEFKIDHSFTFDLAFGSSASNGAPLFPTLPNLVDHAENICKRILQMQ